MVRRSGISRAKSGSSASLHCDRRPTALPYGRKRRPEDDQKVGAPNILQATSGTAYRCHTRLSRKIDFLTQHFTEQPGTEVKIKSR
jgi:hypothetical protein